MQASIEEQHKVREYQRNRRLYELLPAVLPREVPGDEGESWKLIFVKDPREPMIGRQHLIRMRPHDPLRYIMVGTREHPDLLLQGYRFRYDLRPPLAEEYRKRTLPVTGQLRAVLPAQLVRYVQAAT